MNIYSRWNVKLRRDGEKTFKTVQVFARSRDEARKGALKIYEKTNYVSYSMAACEASRIK